jgi:AcrR family transcriptional regulator
MRSPAWIDVALERFEARGFDGTTVEEIAAAAEVAPRTFFRYFPTKASVLFADHPEELARIRATLATRSPGETVIDVVRRAVLEEIGKAVADPSRCLHSLAPGLTTSHTVTTNAFAGPAVSAATAIACRASDEPS